MDQHCKSSRPRLFGWGETASLVGLLALTVLLSVLICFEALAYHQKSREQDRIDRELANLHDEFINERRASEALLQLVERLGRELDKRDAAAGLAAAGR